MVCKLMSKNYDLDRFLRVLRSDILENMRDCKDILEGYKEAVRVEYRLKRSCTRIEGSSPRILSKTGRVDRGQTNGPLGRPAQPAYLLVYLESFLSLIV